MSENESELMAQPKPDWWDAIPHPFREPMLIVDNTAVQAHFADTSALFQEYGIDALHVLHLKAVPFEMITCTGLPADVVVVSSFDDWRKIASFNAERGENAYYSLHFGTPSHKKDQRDRLITTPTVREFTERLSLVMGEKHEKGLTKIIFDGTYAGTKDFESYLFGILDVLKKQELLNHIEIELKMDSRDIVQFDPQIVSQHTAQNGLRDFREWIRYRKLIKENYGDTVKVGMNLYAGNPNDEKKLEYIRSYIIGFRTLFTDNDLYLLPSSISLGGFEDISNRWIMRLIANISEWQKQLLPKTRLVIEHGSNMQYKGGFFAIFPGKLESFQIADLLPDYDNLDTGHRNAFLRFGVKYITVEDDIIAVVHWPISYLQKQMLIRHEREVRLKKRLPFLGNTIKNNPIETIVINK
jgi:hypothetical protein